MGLNVYAVHWKSRGTGAYVPLDPAGGGDYYEDTHGVVFITVKTSALAKTYVLTAIPEASIRNIQCLGPAGAAD